MIYLNRNSENIIGVTATEKATLESFFYLFRFFDVENNKNYLVQLDRDNPTSNRWDKFIVTLPDTIDLPAGKYHYFVYQSEIDGSLEWEGLLELENGKLEVPVEDLNETKFESNGERDYTFIIS